MTSSASVSTNRRRRGFGPSPVGRRCRVAADEGQASFIETGPSTVPFASLWGHLLPTGEGPNTTSPNVKSRALRQVVRFGSWFLVTQLVMAVWLSCGDDDGTQAGPDLNDAEEAETSDAASDPLDDAVDGSATDVAADAERDDEPIDQHTDDESAEDVVEDTTTDESDPEIDLADDQTEDEGPAPPEDVTITALSYGGEPLVAAPVIIHDAAGVVVADGLVTDETGTLVTDVPPGGMVTTVANDSGRQRIMTIMGVQPGDEITLQDPYVFIFFWAPDETLPIRVPGPFPDVGDPLAESYRFQMGCGGLTVMSDPSSGQLMSIPFFSSCYDSEGDNYDVIGWALGANDSPLAFTVETDQTYPHAFGAGDGLSLDNWRQHHELSTFTAVLGNAPAEVEVDVLFYLTRTGRLFFVPGNVPPAGGEVIASAGSGSWQWRYVPGFAGAFRTSFGFDVVGLGDDESQTLTYARLDPFRQPTLAIDITLETPPLIQGLSWEVAESDISTLTWEAIGEGVTADELSIDLAWSEGEGDTLMGHNWHVLAPGTTASPITLPELPGETFSGWRFVDGRRQSASITLRSADFVDGYDDFRQRFGIGPQNLLSSDEESFIVAQSANTTDFDD